MSYRGARQYFGSKKPTKTAQIAAMKQFLASARSLDATTPEMLTRVYGVERHVAVYELTMAQQRRAS